MQPLYLRLLLFKKNLSLIFLQLRKEGWALSALRATAETGDPARQTAQFAGRWEQRWMGIQKSGKVCGEEKNILYCADYRAAKAG